MGTEPAGVQPEAFTHRGSVTTDVGSPDHRDNNLTGFFSTNKGTQKGTNHDRTRMRGMRFLVTDAMRKKVHEVCAAGR